MPHPLNIPATPQTDERNFPRWEKDAPPGRSGHGWPKMLTRPFTKEDRTEWREKHKKLDVNTRQEYYEERCPKLGDPWPIIATEELVDAGLCKVAGQPVIVQDAEEEEMVYEALGITPPSPAPAAVGIPIAGSRELELKQENERLQAQLAGLGEEPEKAPPKRRAAKKRKVVRRAAPKIVTAEQFAEED